MSKPPKYPEGFALGQRIITNARYPLVFRRSPRQRHGEIVAATNDPMVLAVQFDDRTTPERLHRNLFDLTRY